MIKKILKIFITLLPICYLNFNLASNDIEKIQIIKEPFYIESLQLINYEEESVFLKEKLSSYFIINFWASWCAPCIKEMKSLNTLQEKASFLRVLTVSQDRNLKIAKEFFNKNKHPSLEKYYDKDKKVLSKFSIRGLPTTFIVDKKFRVFAKVEGIIDWESDKFIEWLKQY